MKREARYKKPLTGPTIQKIEINEKNKGRRLLAAVLFLALGAATIAYGFLQLVTGSSGWQEIEANSGQVTAAEDFVLSYNLGAAGAAASVESRALTRLYTDAARMAYCLFTADEEIEGVSNVWAVNRHPNEELTVDPALYAAFRLVQASGDRTLYLAPAYELYDDVFLAVDDAYARELDPRYNADMAAYFSRVAAYANDPDSIDVELLDNSRIRLKVSAEYLAYAGENDIERFIDFAWMKNAFIADYLAERLMGEGYTLGSLSSLDGFTRSLGDGISFSLNLYDKGVPAAVLTYDQATATVTLRGYPAGNTDALRFYLYRDGEIRTPYLGADGLDHAAMDDLTAYSREQGCAAILLSLIPAYVRDTPDTAALKSLADHGIYALWCEDNSIHHTEAEATLTDVNPAYTTQ